MSRLAFKFAQKKIVCSNRFLSLADLRVGHQRSEFLRRTVQLPRLHDAQRKEPVPCPHRVGHLPEAFRSGHRRRNSRTEVYILWFGASPVLLADRHEACQGTYYLFSLIIIAANLLDDRLSKSSNRRGGDTCRVNLLLLRHTRQYCAYDAIFDSCGWEFGCGPDTNFRLSYFFKIARK